MIGQLEAVNMLDSAARRYLKMTGDEFVQAWVEGRFEPNPDAHPGVMRVAGLLPLLELHSASSKALSCVTDAVFGNKGGYPSSKPHVLTFAHTDGSVQLPGVNLNVAFIQHYCIVQIQPHGAHRVRTLYYAYGLEDSDTGHEIFAYHWHPTGSSRVRYPHLHLEQGAKLGRSELEGGHLPTGRVSIEDVLTFVVEQFGIKPQRERWRSTLEESAEMFKKRRTWA